MNLKEEIKNLSFNDIFASLLLVSVLVLICYGVVELFRFLKENVLATGIIVAVGSLIGYLITSKWKEK